VLLWYSFLTQNWWLRFKEQLPTRVERKKIVPLTIIFFNLLFCYTILRDTKDVLVVTSGGE
jgi:ATP/ADP translocase